MSGEGIPSETTKDRPPSRLVGQSLWLPGPYILDEDVKPRVYPTFIPGQRFIKSSIPYLNVDMMI